MDNKDYTQLTLEELLIEEKKVKSSETISAFLIGLLVGVIVYGIVKNGFGFVYTSIASFLILVIYRNSKTQKQNLQQIKEEITKKNTN